LLSDVPNCHNYGMHITVFFIFIMHIALFCHYGWMLTLHPSTQMLNTVHLPVKVL